MTHARGDMGWGGCDDAVGETGERKGKGGRGRECNELWGCHLWLVSVQKVHTTVRKRHKTSQARTFAFPLTAVKNQLILRPLPRHILIHSFRMPASARVEQKPPQVEPVIVRRVILCVVRWCQHGELVSVDCVHPEEKLDLVRPLARTQPARSPRASQPLGPHLCSLRSLPHHDSSLS